MKQRRKTLILLAILTSANLVSGQQLAQFSQYLHNPILLNPATSGVNNNVNLKLSYRDQWTGFTDAPKTSYFSIDGTIGGGTKGSSLRSSRLGFTEVKSGRKLLSHGIGGYIVSDTYGAFTNTAGYVSYALHLNITEEIRMSLGLGAGMSAWQMDAKKVEVADPNDNTYDYLVSMGLRKSFFDMNSGIWVFSDKFYIGYSSEQLLQNHIRDIDIPAETKVNIHHFVTGGYKFYLKNDLNITPSLMLKYMSPAPLTLDFNIKVNFKEQMWGGLSYRTNDALVIIAGYNIKDKIHIGYSYDVTLSELKQYSTGSHEILLGYKVFKEARKSSVSFL